MATALYGKAYDGGVVEHYRTYVQAVWRNVVAGVWSAGLGQRLSSAAWVDTHWDDRVRL